MRIGFKAKRIIKAVALALAGVAAITAVAFGVKAIVDYTKNDLKTINPSFEVGSLGSDGKYVADEGSLYTKEAFGCYGLQVKPDFDSGVDYQVFYYDIFDNFVSSSEVLSEGYSADAPVNGAYARMVITPRDDEDGKISFTEKIKYSNELTVKVKKNQNINERFFVLKDRLMQVVYDTQSLVFTNGLSFSEKTLDWVAGASDCVTATTALKVDGGLTINYKALEKYNQSMVLVRQFSDIPSPDNFIDVPGSASDKFVLDKKTKYVIIGLYSGDGSAWDDNDMSALPGCLSISK